jgi:SAM-dependent methyltransferase
MISAARSLNRHGIDVIGLAMHADLRAANSRKQCPACGFEGPFKPFGNPPRWDALCPGCGCLERHRFLSILLNQGLLTEGREILHFAPEKHVGRLLRNYASRYVTADLYMPEVDMKLNIEEIGLPDGSFDVIVCSHVLQYVDDKKALLELRRILRPEGLLILMVPIVDDVSTYEDLTFNPDKRESSFWDRGFRVYGSDFRDLLRSSGFEFNEHIAEGRTAINCALQVGDKIFVCWH